jgi:hypothetical protein
VRCPQCPHYVDAEKTPSLVQAACCNQRSVILENTYFESLSRRNINSGYLSSEGIVDSSCGILKEDVQKCLKHDWDFSYLALASHKGLFDSFQCNVETVRSLSQTGHST